MQSPLHACRASLAALFVLTGCSPQPAEEGTGAGGDSPATPPSAAQSSDSRISGYPLPAGDLVCSEHATLYNQYAADAEQLAANHQASEDSLRQSMLASAEKLTAEFQQEGKIPEYQNASALLKELRDAKQLAELPNDPGDLPGVRSIKALWNQSLGRVREQERLAQHALAVAYAGSLGDKAKELLQGNQPDFAIALDAESKRLLAALEAGEPPADPVTGSFYAIKGDSDWEMFVNGQPITFQGLRSGRIDLTPGDLVVVRVGTKKRQEIRMAYLSDDGEQAIYLRAEDVKLLPPGDPSAVTAKMIADAETHPKGVPMIGPLQDRWFKSGMLPSKYGGSGWLKVPRGGEDVLIAFQVTIGHFGPAKVGS